MNKSVSILLFLTLVGSTIFFFERCGSDPDPCRSFKPVSADFKFQQGFYGVDSLFDVDTVIMGQYRGLYSTRIIFSADEDGATYLWKIGDDPDSFNKQSFPINFTQPYGKVDATLIVSKQPNKACFPNDEGVDTVTRSLFLLDNSKFKFAFEGTFTGYNTDNPKDVFDAIIVDEGPLPVYDPYGNGHYGLRIHNLPDGCGGSILTPEDYNPGISRATYRNFYFNETGATVEGGCPALNGFGRVFDNNNRIIIDYTIGDYIVGPKNPVNISKGAKKFVGTRKK